MRGFEVNRSVQLCFGTIPANLEALNDLDNYEDVRYDDFGCDDEMPDAEPGEISSGLSVRHLIITTKVVVPNVFIVVRSSIMHTRSTSPVLLLASHKHRCHLWLTGTLRLYKGSLRRTNHCIQSLGMEVTL